MKCRLRFRCLAVAWVALARLGAAGEAPQALPRAAFRFVHLSDLHCAHAAANRPPRFFLDPHCCDLVHSFDILRVAVRRINRTVRPDFVIISGDLVDRPGDLRSLRRAKAILDTLACPYYPVIGNHDSRSDWRAVFGPGRLNYAFAYGGWRFVVVDSSPNRLDPHTVAWLRRQLIAHATAPTALVLHHPLVVPALYRIAARQIYGARLVLGNADEVLAVLKQHRNVRAVFAGHCHVAFECTWDGLTQYVAAALAEPGNSFHVVEVRGAAVSREAQCLSERGRIERQATEPQ